MRSNPLLLCLRKLTAVLAVGLLLGWRIDSIGGVLIKYALFIPISLWGGIVPSHLKGVPRLHTLHCVCLMLAFTTFLSYIMPSTADYGAPDVLWVITVSLVAPIFEELFFRGVLVNTSRPLLSSFLSSLIFGAFHGAGFLPAFLLGLLLSYFYLSSEKLALPIICHIANNVLATVCMFFDVRIPVLVLSVAVATVIHLFGGKNEKKIL